MKYLTLVKQLARCAGFDPDTEETSELGSFDQIDGLVETTTNPVGFLWIHASVKDPVYAFWCLLKHGFFASPSYVIFTGVEDERGWADLTRNYDGVRFGSIFMMVCGSETSPIIVPSQRGLFRGED